ncbi:MAG: S-adenosyl-l-methionine hydroxide adenosyltransferase family protein [Bacteroidota bacterium]
MASPIITLTTDWGTKDFYVGALKGRLYSLVPDCNVVDISHDIEQFNTIQAAFILRNSWHRFPANSVHIISVIGTGGGSEPPKLMAAQHEGHGFLGPDDGVFSLMFDELPKSCFHVMDNMGQKVNLKSDLLAASAAFLIKGGDISNMGAPVQNMVSLTSMRPSVDEYSIRGAVIMVDGFGNVVTNISRDLMESCIKGRQFEIFVRKGSGTISSIQPSYQSVVLGDWVAIYNESGYVELAIREGNAGELMGIGYGDMVRVEFR